MKRFSVLIAAVTAVAGGATFAIAEGVATASGSSESSTLPTISIAMDGKSIAVGGTLQSGAVNVQSTVTGEPFGSPALVRLNPGVTYEQFFATLQTPAVGRDPNAISPVGSIVFDAAAPPGASDAQTQLEPGDYVALDTAHERPPFPSATFTIAQSSSPATLPSAEATESAIDFRFRGPTVLHNGQLVRERNDGWTVHMAEAFGVRNATAGRRAVRLLRAGHDKPAQRLATKAFFSFFEPASHGAVQQAVLHAKPGYYVEVCHMDAQDGREHTRLGMARVIRVVG
jgi:hypothetical protein